MSADLRFLHICERFWIHPLTGKFDIIGCFDRFTYHLIHEEDGTCFPFTAPPFSVVVGVSGLTENCIFQMSISGPETDTESPKTVYSDTILVNHADPLGQNILSFNVKDLTIPLPGRYIVEVSAKSVARNHSSIIGVRVLIMNGIEPGNRGAN